ncbi:MAG: peptide deformylase, partial [Rhodobacteraceae bacterium]|nr:peptide deformylase [Paracoccaceae bacterium]
MKRNILLHPDPRLKKAAAPVADLSDGLRRLADDMVETMYGAPGIGLAAPQVGVLERLIVLDCTPDDSAECGLLVMFNPQIMAQSDETSSYEEGCLSIPDHYGQVTRPAEVTVTWLDRDGTQQQQDFSGLWSTCVQHEIDHLNGK